MLQRRQLVQAAHRQRARKREAAGARIVHRQAVENGCQQQGRDARRRPNQEVGKAKGDQPGRPAGLNCARIEGADRRHRGRHHGGHHPGPDRQEGDRGQADQLKGAEKALRPSLWNSIPKALIRERVGRAIVIVEPDGWFTPCRRVGSGWPSGT